MNVSGKRVLLTGATGGLGHAIARQLAGAGAHVILSGRRGDVLADLAKRDLRRRRAGRPHRPRRRARARRGAHRRRHPRLQRRPVGLGADRHVDRGADRPRAGRQPARARSSSPARSCRTWWQRGEGHVVFMSSLAGKTPTAGIVALQRDEVRAARLRGRDARRAARHRRRRLGDLPRLHPRRRHVPRRPASSCRSASARSRRATSRVATLQGDRAQQGRARRRAGRAAARRASSARSRPTSRRRSAGARAATRSPRRTRTRTWPTADDRGRAGPGGARRAGDRARDLNSRADPRARIPLGEGAWTQTTRAVWQERGAASDRRAAGRPARRRRRRPVAADRGRARHRQEPPARRAVRPGAGARSSRLRAAVPPSSRASCRSVLFADAMDDWLLRLPRAPPRVARRRSWRPSSRWCCPRSSTLGARPAGRAAGGALPRLPRHPRPALHARRATPRSCWRSTTCSGPTRAPWSSSPTCSPIPRRGRVLLALAFRPAQIAPPSRARARGGAARPAGHAPGARAAELGGAATRCSAAICRVCCAPGCTARAAATRSSCCS